MSFGNREKSISNEVVFRRFVDMVIRATNSNVLVLAILEKLYSTAFLERAGIILEFLENMEEGALLVSTGLRTKLERTAEPVLLWFKYRCTHNIGLFCY
jgi:hypothetical protein